MIVNISNCNNIYQGRIDIIEGSLNVKYVENDYLYQLNPRKYDTVPQFVIDECTADISLL